MLRDVRQAAPAVPRQAGLPSAPPAAAIAPVTGTRAVLTRALDIGLTLAGLIVAGPLLVAGWLLARASSPGPGLFRQQRLGRDGVPFTMLKLRTMKVNCDDAQHRAYVQSMLAGEPGAQQRGLYKLARDPRITAIGAFLRKTSLDELPQLINVLRGDMSLVGPRPPLAWEAEMYRAADRLRFAVRPGITGLWQVSGRSRLSMREALDLDSDFVRHYTVRQYLTILARTGPALLRGGAT
jgi:lipopolysaccharide/colanic/teichoic acid biosynthesis glycosyltransferase